MSFATIAKSARDMTLADRVTACCAGEITANNELADPSSVMSTLMWPVSAASDIEAAYASALAADNPNPGGDETVVTDPMILSAVQANWPPGLPQRE